LLADEKLGPVFILVHGTFATNALWTKSGSQLTQRLIREYPSAEILPFVWSGKNNHEARLSAGIALAKFIKEQCTASHRKVNVVAHSHGGNAILYALRDVQCRQSVESIVFLGTPFLQIKDRRPALVATILVRFSMLWVFLAALLTFGIGNVMLQYFVAPYIAVALYIALDLRPFESPIPVVAAFFTCVGLSYWAAKLSVNVSKSAIVEGLAGFVSHFLTNSIRMTRAMTWWLRQPEPSCPCLVMYTPLDEARLVLSSAAFLADFGWSMQKLFWTSISWTWGAVVVAAMLFIGPDERQFSEDGHTMIVWLLIYSLIGIAFLYLGDSVSELLSKFVRKQKFAFGSAKFPRASRYTRVLATAAPNFAYMHNVTLVQQRFHGKGLHHSAFYADAEALEKLVRWLQLKALPKDPEKPAEGNQSEISIEQLTMHPLPAALGAIIGFALSWPIWTWPVSVPGAVIAAVSFVVASLLYFLRRRFAQYSNGR
jgi:hypothetical protein